MSDISNTNILNKWSITKQLNISQYIGKLCLRHNNSIRYTTNSSCIKCHYPFNKEKHALASRKCAFKKFYNLTQDQYEEKVKLQNGLCAICHKKPKKILEVDHNHQTGSVRGLLCRKCNMALGFLHEDTEIITNLLQYIRDYNGC